MFSVEHKHATELKKTYIFKELIRHAPFTSFGAATGVAVALLTQNVPFSILNKLFHIFHPLHMLLSAVVTTSMYLLYSGKKLYVPLIGYLCSIPICSLSDIILPFVVGLLGGARMKLHICFIEEWWLINPLAFFAIIIGYLRPITRCPHACHVFLSTFASLFYLASFGGVNLVKLLPFVFIVLFFAVWLPCCLSDIIFPLLFAKSVCKKRKQ